MGKILKDARTDFIKKLINEKSPSMKAFAESIDMPYTTLRSILERGIGNASVDNVFKVCRGLNIKADELEKLAQGEQPEKVPDLTAKDERDIQRELERMIEGLESNSSYAAFDGETIDDLDEEDKELLRISLENSLRVAKKLAKQKFTPKKYRK
jgi:transcriptional regulator with XRE-family HTH domain